MSSIFAQNAVDNKIQDNDILKQKITTNLDTKVEYYQDIMLGIGSFIVWLANCLHYNWLLGVNYSLMIVLMQRVSRPWVYLLTYASLCVTSILFIKTFKFYVLISFCITLICSGIGLHAKKIYPRSIPLSHFLDTILFAFFVKTKITSLLPLILYRFLAYSFHSVLFVNLQKLYNRFFNKNLNVNKPNE